MQRSNRLQIVASAIAIVISLICQTGSTTQRPAPPQDISGTFVFQGFVKKMAILHLERVYTLFEEGQKRLDELTELGYTCEPYGSHWTACHKIRDDLELPEWLIQQAQAEPLNQLRLRFGGITAPPQLTHETEFQWEWTISQNVDLNGKFQQSYRIVHMEHVEKMMVQGKEFLLNYGTKGITSFSNVQSVSQETQDQTGYLTYYYELVLEKE